MDSSNLIFFAFMFYPLICLSAWGLKAYLKSASKGRFEMEIPNWLIFWKHGEAYGYYDTAKPINLPLFLTGFFGSVGLGIWLVYTFGISSEQSIEFITLVSEKQLPFIFNIGVFFTGFIVTGIVLVVAHKLIGKIFDVKETVDKLQEKLNNE